MKNILPVLLAAICLPTIAGLLPLPEIGERLTVDAEHTEYLRVSVEGMYYRGEPVGAPALPVSRVEVPLAANERVEKIELQAEWETVSVGTEIYPEQEPFALYEGAPLPEFTPPAPEFAAMSVYPADNLEILAVQTDADGARKVPVILTPFRYYPAEKRLEVARKATLQVTTAKIPVARKTMSVDDAPAVHVRADYVLIGAPDLIDTWRWYVEKRQLAHPEVVCAAVNSADIYAAYPFNAANTAASGTLPDGGLLPRNSAESIHAFLRRQYREFGTKYVVLAGPWIDAQATDNEIYLETGELLSLSNAIPGVIGYPREDWRQIPSDLFFACLDFTGTKSGAVQTNKWPWDANGDGIYINQDDCANNDFTAELAVGRLPMKPSSLYPLNASGKMMGMAELITNYVAKLERGESRDFAGAGRFGAMAGSCDYKKYPLDHNMMYRNELEYYDNVYNMFDPRRNDYFNDNEREARRRFKEMFATSVPVLEGRSMHYAVQTKGVGSTTAERRAHYYAGDREAGFNFGHGWAQGTDDFQAGEFAKASGLTLFNDVGVSCDTGYVDYTVTKDGKQVATICLGDSGVNAPFGGCLTSMNNTRWGWSGGTGGTFHDGLSVTLMQNALEAFTMKRWNAGDSWKYTVYTYATQGRGIVGSTAGWCLTEEMLFGDPLVRAPAVTEFSTRMPAENELVRSLSLSGTAAQVTNHTGAVAMSVTGTGDEFTIGGAGSMRVMQKLSVTNANLRVDCAGGAGAGVEFVANSPKTITLAGPDGGQFYLGGAVNADTIRLNGAGAVVDWDLVDNTAVNITLDGPGADIASANVIRSKNAGSLTRVGTIAARRTALTLETYEAFGDDEETPVAVLDEALLTYRQNPYWGLAGYTERLSRPLVMTNSTLCVDYTPDFYLDEARISASGDNRFDTIGGGVMNLSGTSEVTLPGSADRVTLAAKFVNAGEGRLVFNGSGTVVIPDAASPAGEIEIGAGVTLKLEQIPLVNVTSLVFKPGAKVILPPSEDGFYRITPIQSHLELPAGVIVEDVNGTAIEGTGTETGGFFQKGALLEWSVAEGSWSKSAADRPWRRNGESMGYTAGWRTYFPDVTGGSATVNVVEPIELDFTYFANSSTEYIFQRKNGAEYVDAQLILEELMTGGDVKFNDLPLIVSGRTDVSGGELTVLGTFVTPQVHISNGGILYAPLMSGFDGAHTEVNIDAGGTLALSGSPLADISMAEGTVLRAVPGEHLTWSDNINATLPESMTLNLDDLELSSTPTLLIDGDGHEWNVSDLARFTLSRDDAVLRFIDGALYAIAGDANVGSVYYRNIFGDSPGTPEWDTEEWLLPPLEEYNFFERRWSETPIDWAGTAMITTEGDCTFLVNTDVVLDKIVFRPGMTSGWLYFQCMVGNSVVGSFNVNEVDLTEYRDCTITFCAGSKFGHSLVRSGENDVVCYEETSGRLEMVGGTITFLNNPSGEWELTDNVQGTAYVVVSGERLAERRRIFTVSEDFEFPKGGFEIVAIRDEGSKATPYVDFTVEKDGDGLYLVPPPVTAEVASDSTWTALPWKDFKGDNVSITDWTKVMHAELRPSIAARRVTLDAAPVRSLHVNALNNSGLSVTVAANGGAGIKLPGELTLDSPLEINGAILPEITKLTGAATLTLNDAGEVLTPKLVNDGYPFGNQAVTVNGETVLVFTHAATRKQENANWSKLTGNGAVEIRAEKSGIYFTLPSNNGRWSNSLGFVNNSDIVMEYWYSENSPFTCGYLAGSGSFRTDYGANGKRIIRTVQTRTSTWSGFFHNWSGARPLELYVASNLSTQFEEDRNTSRLLTLANGSGNQIPVSIEKSGAVEFAVPWTAQITNNGGIIALISNGFLSSVNTTADSYVALTGGTLDFTAGAFEGQDGVYTSPCYKLMSPANGAIRFGVWNAGFGTMTPVMKAKSKPAFDTANSHLTLIAVSKTDYHKYDMNNVKWSSDVMINGNVVYWTAQNYQSVGAKTVALAAGSHTASDLGVDFWGSVSEITIAASSNSPTSVELDEDFASFDGKVHLAGGIRIENAKALASTLATAPTGTVQFVVADTSKEQNLMKVEADFTLTPGAFNVEVVDENGNNDADWTWYVDGGFLKYRLVNMDSIIHGMHFDGDLAEYGGYKMAINATPPENNFIDSRNGKAITTYNGSWGNNFNLSSDNWTLFLCAKLSTVNNAVHWCLGTAQNGGLALTTDGANNAAISRWITNTAHTDLVSVPVTERSSRFHAYAIVYRNGSFTLYVDGERRGEAVDLEAPKMFGSTNWQFFSLFGGPYSTGLVNGGAGAIDELRLFHEALTEGSIRRLSAEFSPWPDKYAEYGGIRETKAVSDIGGGFFVGNGTLVLAGAGKTELYGVADSGRLVISNGVTVTAAITGDNTCTAFGREIEILEGGVLELTLNAGRNCSNADMSRITGNGTLRISGTPVTNFIVLPTNTAKRFADTLNFVADCEITLDAAFADNAMSISNLSGGGKFANNYGAAGSRKVFVTQTGRSEFTGTFNPDTNNGGIRSVAMIVTGDGVAPSLSRTLTLSGNETAAHQLTVTESGCVKLVGNSAWNGTIVNDGLLFAAPAADEEMTLSNCTISGSGKIGVSGSGVLRLNAGFAPVISSLSRGVLQVVVDSLPVNAPLAALNVEDNFVYPADGLLIEPVDASGNVRENIVISVNNGKLMFGMGAKTLHAIKLLVK